MTMTAQKPYSSEKMDEIRKQIDSLDSKIHDALMERAELVLKISEEKKKNNIQVVQPAREARMIRRLLERHKGALPEMAVVRIWRELVGAVSLLQTGLKVAVSVRENDQNLWDMAKDYFGSCLPMQKSPSPMAAIGAVREGKVTFAVLPYPQDTEEQPWWLYLWEDASNPLRISIRLPHGEAPGSVSSDSKALIVSQTGFDDSGDDHSFIMIQAGSAVSRGKLVDVAKKIGLDPKNIFSKRVNSQYDPSFHLLETSGFVGDDDPRLKKLAQELNDGTVVKAVGGFPVPPVYSKAIDTGDKPFPKAQPSEKQA